MPYHLGVKILTIYLLRTITHILSSPHISIVLDHMPGLIVCIPKVACTTTEIGCPGDVTTVESWMRPVYEHLPPRSIHSWGACVDSPDPVKARKCSFIVYLS